MSLKLLDLFCGSGGASIVGFQNQRVLLLLALIQDEKMPFYCGNKFIQDNVFNLSLDFIKSFRTYMGLPTMARRYFFKLVLWEL